MRTDAFDYLLPPELIAARPLAERDAGRLCVVSADAIRHAWVREFPALVTERDLVVLNETRVRQARTACHRWTPGQTEPGAKVEILFLSRKSDQDGEEIWSALGRANRPFRVGDELRLGQAKVVVRSRGEQGLLEVGVTGAVEPLLAEHGVMPIPPYMQRDADGDDLERYQTVFARRLGSAAAPTAGLHLTHAMLADLETRGVRVARLTLHVGIGTFRPVQVADLDDHPMHSEWFEVSRELATEIEQVRRRGGRVVAVGTTVVRALESARDPERAGFVLPYSGETRLLIQPGYPFSVVDAMLTNFHMPRSTLLALVAAFAGHERVARAYREAVAECYRFLSYGDAMWLPCRCAETPAGRDAK